MTEHAWIRACALDGLTKLSNDVVCSRPLLRMQASNARKPSVQPQSACAHTCIQLPQHRLHRPLGYIGVSMHRHAHAPSDSLHPTPRPHAPSLQPAQAGSERNGQECSASPGVCACPCMQLLQHSLHMPIGATTHGDAHVLSGSRHCNPRLHAHSLQPSSCWEQASPRSCAVSHWTQQARPCMQLPWHSVVAHAINSLHRPLARSCRKTHMCPGAHCASPQTCMLTASSSCWEQASPRSHAVSH